MTNTCCKIHSEMSHKKSIKPDDRSMIPILPISIWWFFTRDNIHRNKIQPNTTEKKALH